jgi:O-antigen/teichoic acid export membrane protein
LSVLNRLAKNMSYMSVGTLIYAGCQWGMLILLAKLGSQEMVGQYTFAFSVTAPIIMFSNMQLRQVYISDRSQSHDYTQYLILRLFTLLISCITIFLFVILSNFSSDTALVVLIIGWSKVAESISDILQAFLQYHEEFRPIFISNTLKGISSLVFTGLVLFTSRNIVLSVFANSFAWFATLVLYDYPACKRFAKQHKLPFLKLSCVSLHIPSLVKLLKTSFPLGVSILLVSLSVTSSNYIVARNIGLKELGLFSAILYIIEVGNRITVALAESSQPKLAAYYSTLEIKKFQKLLLYLIGIGTACGGVMILLSFVFGQQILNIMYGKAYGDNASLLQLISVVALLRYINNFFISANLATRQFWAQTFSSGLSFILVTISCIQLIPLFGLFGAALALLITAFVQLLSSAAILTVALPKTGKL